MTPQWRTSTVLALCRRMLDAREFDTMPILADALQDAGCTDRALLACCQDPELRSVQAERLVNLAYSEETAAAVRWLEQFVRDINSRHSKDKDDKVGTPSDSYRHNYEDIIYAGHLGASEGRMNLAEDGVAYFRKSNENRREFFRNWSLVTGVAVPEEAQETIDFSCTC